MCKVSLFFVSITFFFSLQTAIVKQRQKKNTEEMFTQLQNNFKMEEESQKRSLTDLAFEKKNTTLSLKQKQKKIQTYKKRKNTFHK